MAKGAKGVEISSSDPVADATNGLAILARMIARKQLQRQRERLDASNKPSPPPSETDNENLP